ncbi:10866_t:CDS:2, partial [Diversispora eburnea]
MVCDALDLDNEEAEEEMYKLTRSFVNPHRNFEIPTTNQVFKMETGKNDVSLFPGQIVTVQIMPEVIQVSKKAIPVHIPISSPIRIILHPMFHQMTYSKAVQYLKDKSNGSYVVKPTPKGFGYIAITYIVEKDKAGVSVGLRLEVEGCKYIYSDLGELIVQYVEPKARRAEDLMAHAKFKSSVENLNSLEMNPNHSSYGFCFDYEMP